MCHFNQAQIKKHPLQRLIQYSFVGLLMFLLLSLIGIAAMLWTYNYTQFSSYVLIQLGKEHLLPTFQNIFPETRYHFIQYAIWIFTFVYGLSLIFILKKRDLIARSMLLVTKKIKTLLCVQFQKIQQLSKLEKALFFAIISISTALTIYRIVELELIYDEIWTYLYFTQHLPIMAIATYPAPNNHVLFSLMSSVLYHLGVPDVWALRSPVLLCSILTNVLFWLFVTRYFGRRIAFLSLSFFAFCLPISLYAVYGRGYVLLVFFSLLSLWALLKWVEQAHNKTAIWLFVAATVGGFYTIPTFLYVYLLWGIFVCFHVIRQPVSWSFFFDFLKISVVVLVLTLVLYSPILLVYGLEQALNNMSQFGINSFSELLQRFPAYFMNLLNFFGGNKYLAAVLYLFIFCQLFMIKRRDLPIFQTYIIQICGLALIFPILFYFIQKSQIPTRVWTFEALFLSLSMGLLVTFFIKSKAIMGTKMVLLCLIIAAISGYGTQTNSFWKNIRQSTQTHHDLTQYLMQQEANTCFLNYYVIKPHIEYYSLKHKKLLQLYMAQKGSVDYHDLKNTDEIDILVLGKGTDYAEDLEMSATFWNKYQQTYEDEQVQIYQLKK